MTARVATLVLAGASPWSTQLEERLREWSEAGIVQPFLWVADPRRGEAQDGSRLIQRGVATEEPFSRFITGTYDRFRLVLVQLAPDTDNAPNAGARTLARWVAETIEHRKASEQVLKRISVVVPSTEAEVLPSDSVMQHWEGKVWDTNVVAFPEDRPGPTSAFRAVGTSSAFVEHAALQVATAGGLWSGCEEGPYDEIESRANEPRIITARTFARVVRGALLVDGVLAQGLPLSDRRGNARQVAALVGGRPARQPDRVVEEAAYATAVNAGGGVLQFHLEEPPHGEGAQIEKGLKALLVWLTFMVTGIPKKVVERILRRLRRRQQQLSRRITNLYGEDPDTIVSVGGVIDPTLLPDREANGMHIPQPDGPGWDPSRTAYMAPDLWRDLRAITFGLLDGGRLPEFLRAPTVGSEREIIVEPLNIAPAPDGHTNVASIFGDACPPDWSIEDAVPLIDPALMREWIVWLDAAIAEAELIAGTFVAAPAAPPQPEAEPALWGEAPEAAPVPESVRRLEQLRNARALVTTLIESRRGTFLWRVTATLDEVRRTEVEMGEERVRSAESAAERKRQEFEATQKKDYRLGKWGRRFRFLLKAAVLAAVVVPIIRFALNARGGGSGWGSVFIKIITGQFLGTALASGLVTSVLKFGIGGILVTWFVELLREIAKDFKVLHARRDWDDLNRFAKEFRNAIELEKVRLGAHYEHLVDWVEALAWMVHRPFGAATASSAGSARAFGGAPARPLALGFADGVVTPDRLGLLAESVCREALGAGWITRAFDLFAGRWLAAKAWASLGQAQEAIDILDQSADGAEVREVAAQIQDGTLGQSWLAELREAVLGRLAKMGPDDLFDRVEGIAEPGAPAVASVAAAAPPGDFLKGVFPGGEGTARGGRNPFIGGDDAAGIWTTDAYNRNASEIAMTSVWLPQPLAISENDAVTLRPAKPVITPDGSCLFMSVRVDVTAGLPPSSFALFRPVATRAAADTASKGPEQLPQQFG